MAPLSRRALLGGALSALSLAAGRHSAWAEVAALRERALRKGLFYGCCASTAHFGDAPFIQALAREAGALVPEWEGKRGRIEARRGVLDFSAADRLAEFAANHGMLFRGHTLVWWNSNPAWLNAALDAASPPESLLTGYVDAVVAHFRGRVHSWDVVNEAIEPKDGRPDGLRACPWLRAFGPAYLDIAYHTARAADPGALLVYNDYGMDTADPWQAARQHAVIGLLEGFRRRGVPCDALGLQAHLKTGSNFDQEHLRRFLAEVTALGYRTLITELDVADHGGMDIAARDRAVADLAGRYLEVALDQPQTIGVVTWGLSDRYTWLDRRPWTRWVEAWRPRPLPLDSALRRKPMWHAIARAIDAAPHRPGG
ncbi:MAG: endo-1,4-beta-xylanase [Magnetospirillum sp.]|nr:endo-1,4-beta-xylanase [Magnetospirillum sp.]